MNHWITALAGGLVVWALIGLTNSIVSNDNTPDSLSNFTDTFVQVKQDMIACDALELCTEVAMKYYVFINHPDNQTDLLRCEKNGKCYEAMMDMTTFMITDFISKLGDVS